MLELLTSFGWNDVTNLDNDVSVGGGWADDLMNDAKYALLMRCSCRAILRRDRRARQPRPYADT